MEHDTRSARTQSFCERELNRLRKAAEAGNELAPAAGLFFCNQHKVAAPDWLIHRASLGYCKQLGKQAPKTRGRSSGTVDRCRQDMVDLMRWDVVRQSRYRQKEFSDSLKANADAPAELRFHPLKMSAWYGRDWLRAYECASMILRDTPAFGGPDAMKASYCRVERFIDHPIEGWRYFLFDPDFLESIGLEHPSRWKQSSKFVPLYNLTL